jgi:hypothetical protein
MNEDVIAHWLSQLAGTIGDIFRVHQTIVHVILGVDCVRNVSEINGVPILGNINTGSNCFFNF